MVALPAPSPHWSLRTPVLTRSSGSRSRVLPGCLLAWERRQGPQVPLRLSLLFPGVGSVSLTVRFRFEVSQLRPQTGPHLGSLACEVEALIVTELHPGSVSGCQPGVLHPAAALLPPGPGPPGAACRPRVHRNEVSDLPIEFTVPSHCISFRLCCFLPLKNAQIPYSHMAVAGLHRIQFSNTSSSYRSEGGKDRSGS